MKQNLRLFPAEKMRPAGGGFPLINDAHHHNHAHNRQPSMGLKFSPIVLEDPGW